MKVIPFQYFDRVYRMKVIPFQYFDRVPNEGYSIPIFWPSEGYSIPIFWPSVPNEGYSKWKTSVVCTNLGIYVFGDFFNSIWIRCRFFYYKTSPTIDIILKFQNTLLHLFWNAYYLHTLTFRCLLYIYFTFFLWQYSNI